MRLIGVHPAGQHNVRPFVRLHDWPKRNGQLLCRVSPTWYARSVRIILASAYKIASPPHYFVCSLQQSFPLHNWFHISHHQKMRSSSAAQTTTWVRQPIRLLQMGYVPSTLPLQCLLLCAHRPKASGTVFEDPFPFWRRI